MSRITGSKDGILLVAHSRASYLTEAVTLAKSIRRFSARIPIALVTNLHIPERLRKAAGFSTVVHHDFSAFQGLEFKWHLETLSPFSGTSLFLDSDSICYGDISKVFDTFPDKDFVTLGTSLKDCHWFQDAARTMALLGINEFPFFCGDFYLCRKTTLTRDILATAHDIAKRYDELGIHRLGSILNDEPIISLAMARHGINAEPCGNHWILQMQAWGLEHVELDWTVPRAWAVVAGTPAEPKLIHFAAHRTTPLYYREKFLVHSHGNPFSSTALAKVIGNIQSVVTRASRRVRKAFRP